MRIGGPCGYRSCSRVAHRTCSTAESATNKPKQCAGAVCDDHSGKVHYGKRGQMKAVTQREKCAGCCGWEGDKPGRSRPPQPKR